MLTNLKDRSTPIFGLYAVHGNVVIPLIEFENPIVLKSFESIKIEVPPVSEYWLGGEPFTFPIGISKESERIDIHYTTINKFKKCVPLSPPSLMVMSLKKGRRLQRVMVHKVAHNGRVYSANVIYIVEYEIHGKWHSAFIDSGGLIHWDFSPNAIPQSILSEPQAVADSLLRSRSIFERLFIRKTYGWNRKFASGKPVDMNVDDVAFVGTRMKEKGQ